MAVTSCKLKRSRKYSVNDKMERKGTRVYLVTCSDHIADDADTAAAAAPAVNSSWSLTDPGLVVTDVSSDENSEGPGLFDVTVNYSSRSRDPGQQEEDPLARDPIIDGNFDKFEQDTYVQEDTEPWALDADDNPVTLTSWKWKKNICTSAGEDFETGLKKVWRDIGFTITRNEEAIPWTVMASHGGRINSDSVTYGGKTFGAYTLLLDDIDFKQQYENGVKFWTVTYKFLVRNDEWYYGIKDSGLEELNAGDIPRVPIRDANGDPVKKPCLLDGQGQKKTDNTAVFLFFRLDKTAAFTGLSLDTPVH